MTFSIMSILRALIILIVLLSRWVQDPEQQKKKKENAILDSLRVVSVALDVHTNTAKVSQAALLYSLGTGIGLLI